MKISVQVVLLSLIGAIAVRAAEIKSKPNIIILLADDLGYGDTSCYGCPDIRTPNIDKLAAQGVRFTNGYSCFPVCSPSRAALLTGRYPNRIGPTFEDYFGGGSPGLDPQRHMTIGQMLKNVGYDTACFGKWNVSGTERRPANDYGFDIWVGLHNNHDYFTHKLVRTNEMDLFENGAPLERDGIWSDTIFADEAIRYITEKKDKPFFIYLCWQTPHTPIQDPTVPFDSPKSHDAQYRPIYVKMVERLDSEIGRIMQTLDKNGLTKNTLIILTSDNGGAKNISRNLPLRGNKQELYEGGVRVPFIISWPGVLPNKKEYDAPATLMDITATVAAAGLAQAPDDAPLDGNDLLPELIGKKSPNYDRPLFWRRRTVNAYKGDYPIRQSSVRQGDWKYLRTYKTKGKGSSDKEYDESLYNLKDDLAENSDLAQKNPDKLTQLSSLLSQWESEMDTTAMAPPKPDRKKKKLSQEKELSDG